MNRLVLASTSPRRQQLLATFGIPFDVVPPDYEEVFDETVSAEELAVRLAAGKAESVARHGEATIGADTFLAFEGSFLGKPKDEADAIEQLTRLSGEAHDIVTGCAVVDPQLDLTAFVVRSTVVLRSLTEREIRAYVATGEPLDKAGSYALQGKGAVLVERVEGDASAIIGLPVGRLSVELQRLGYRLWEG
jgi:septum formation protein